MHVQVSGWVGVRVRVRVSRATPGRAHRDHSHDTPHARRSKQLRVQFFGRAVGALHHKAHLRLVSRVEGWAHLGEGEVDGDGEIEDEGGKSESKATIGVHRGDVVSVKGWAWYGSTYDGDRFAKT